MTPITKQTIIEWCKKHNFHVAPAKLTVEGREVLIDNGKVYAYTAPGYREIKSEELFVSFFDPIREKRIGTYEYNAELNAIGYPIVCYDKYTKKPIGEYPSIRRASNVHKIPQVYISNSIKLSEPIGDIYFEYRD